MVNDLRYHETIQICDALLFSINKNFRCEKSRVVRQESNSGKSAFKTSFRTKLVKADEA